MKKFKTIPMENCVISSITLAELRYWVARNKLHHKEDFNSLVADKSGEVRAELESKGKKIGSEDLMIGAHALSLDYILVTNNVKEFKRIAGLRIEDWV